MKPKVLILTFVLISVFSHIFSSIPKENFSFHGYSIVVSPFFWNEVSSHKCNIKNDSCQIFIIADKKIIVTAMKFNPQKFPNKPNNPTSMTFLTATYYFSEARKPGYYTFKKDGRNYFIKDLTEEGNNVCSFKLTARAEEIKKIEMITDKKSPLDLKIEDESISIFAEPKKVKYVMNGQYYNLIGEAIATSGYTAKDTTCGFLIEKRVTDRDVGQSFVGEEGDIYIIIKGSLILQKNGQKKYIALCPRIKLRIE